MRRRRQTTRAVSRMLPVAAAGLVVAAAAIRFTETPVSVFWALLVVTIAGVAVFALLAARVPVVTDKAAARVDADARLGGELRSAFWFSSQSTGNDWTAFHLDRAAERAQQVTWADVYPPASASRAWAGSAALGAVAVALVSIQALPFAGRGVAGVVRSGGAAVAGEDARISPELQKKIDDLLKAVAAGQVPMDEAREKLSDLRDMLSKVDPALQAAAAKAAKDQAQSKGAHEKSTEPELDDLGTRAEKMAEDLALPEDVKWSLQDLAAKLAKASQPPDAANDGKTSAEAKSARAEGQPPKDAPAAPANQMVRVTTAETQTDPMMASQASPMSGDPHGGNGDSARKTSAAAPLDLSGALRKMSVEAAADSEGANVLSEMRRKSEQSRSTLGFSHVAPLAAYDPSRATPPPPPPDALRPLVQHYFIRR